MQDQEKDKSSGKNKKGKGSKGKSGKGGKIKISKASRAGFTFNVGQVLRQMRERKYVTCVSPLAAVLLVATIEVNLYFIIYIW